MLGNSTDETNFPHKLLLTGKQTLRLRNVFLYNSSANISLSKAQFFEMGSFLGRILGQLMKVGLQLMKTVIKPLAKCVSMPLGLTMAASALDSGINKKNLVWELDPSW